MGEVIAAAILLVVVVAAIVGAVVVVHGLVAPDRQHTAEGINHQAMARWIDHALNDEMERACLEEPRRQAALFLLNEYYNAGGKQGG